MHHRSVLGEREIEGAQQKQAFEPQAHPAQGLGRGPRCLFTLLVIPSPVPSYDSLGGGKKRTEGAETPGKLPPPWGDGGGMQGLR